MSGATSLHCSAGPNRELAADRVGGEPSCNQAGDVVVLKFGGTALASPPRVRRAAERVRAQVRAGRTVVVVVSAAGRETDRLLARIGAVAAAEQGHRPAGPRVPRGENGTGPIVAAGGALDTTADVIGSLGDVANGAATRELDRILATGEDRSAGLLALALTLAGVPARSLRGGEAGIRGAGDFGAGAIERVETELLHHLLGTGIVPVISGFQAVRADGETVTLGRGGSDISAVAIAAALGAATCHIVTDVDAVYDRDPRVDPGARPFASLEHAELIALTEAGAEVVHPRAARLAAAHAIPLRVYGHRAPNRDGSGSGENGGTWIGRIMHSAGTPVAKVSGTEPLNEIDGLTPGHPSNGKSIVIEAPAARRQSSKNCEPIETL